jgi:hypothetical protein
MVSRPVCLGVKHPSGAYVQIFNTVRRLRVCWYGALSLMRERVYRLQFPLAIASTVIHGSESRGTRDRISLSQIRDSPNPEGQVLILTFLRNWVAQLYPQTLSSPFFASYDSQGYGGGLTNWSQSQSRSHIATDGQSINKSWCRALSVQIFSSLWHFGLVFVGRPLWRDDGPLFCICCWVSPA